MLGTFGNRLEITKLTYIIFYLVTIRIFNKSTL